MFPIEAPDLKTRILKEVVPTYLRDNQRARILQRSGSYARVLPLPGEAMHRSQEEFLAMREMPLEHRAAGNGQNGAARLPVSSTPAAPRP
jgi:polyphosphate kinase